MPNALPLAAGVELIAHRGASRDAPENTLASFREAWRQRADSTELDIRLSKEGRIVVIHDATTRRTTGHPGHVARMAFAELRRLDAGRWKGEQFIGQRLPTLPEVFATVPAGKRVYIEVKCGVESIPELGRAIEASKLGLERLPILSFHRDVIAAVKQARPAGPAYWLVDLEKKNEKPPKVRDLIERAREVRADGLDVSACAALDERFAAQVKSAGLRLVVFTVNDARTARRMIQFGVDGITTDRPGWLRERLGL